LLATYILLETLINLRKQLNNLLINPKGNDNYFTENKLYWYTVVVSMLAFNMKVHVLGITAIKRPNFEIPEN